MLSFLYVYSDHSILECYNLFSGVELSMRSFCYLWRDRWNIWAKKKKYFIFPGLSKGTRPNSSLNGWKALNYIFLDQKFPSVTEIVGGKLENNAFLDNFPTDPSTGFF